MATVNANMFSAGVRADPHPQPLSLMSLPLNLVALILSYVSRQCIEPMLVTLCTDDISTKPCSLTMLPTYLDCAERAGS